MKVKSDIPIFNQSNEAIGGIHVVKLPMEDQEYHTKKLQTHRDNYFIFFILTQGSVSMRCDTVNLEISSPSIILVKPYQIHSVNQVSDTADGYFISAAPFLIPKYCTEIFGNLEIVEQGKEIDAALIDNLLNHISLLHHAFKKKQLNKTAIINGLFNALVYSFSNLFQTPTSITTKPKNQSSLITANFKKLIYEHSFLESPSFFAKKLNISTSHLNDSINAITGKSITYWLQNAMIIEAQRLLYYTDNDVKEVAYLLGFADHSYFSRLFRKICKETPLAFRNKFR